MSSLLVVTGPPGAGKSTIARLLVQRFERSVLVEGDAFYAFLAGGAVAPWLPGARQQNEVVTRAAATAAGTYARGGYTAVFDGMVGPWLLPTFVEATGLDTLDYIVLLPPVEQCVERVASRAQHHFADEDATRKMHREFTAASIDPRHVLHHPPERADEVADVVLAARAAGSLACRAGTAPS